MVPAGILSLRFLSQLQWLGPPYPRSWPRPEATVSPLPHLTLAAKGGSLHPSLRATGTHPLTHREINSYSISAQHPLLKI